jgi:ribosomal protein L11 methyltransferase
VVGPGCLLVEAVGADDRELVADRCWALGATAVGETDVGLEVGFPTDHDARSAGADLVAWRPELRVRVVDAAPALAAALEAWRPFARPIRVGALHVRPAWLDPDDDPPAVGERVVVVDPTRAFGYDHPSTVACLEAVAALARPGVAVLDVGCGSGVLAMGAAALGAAPVVAVDTDPVAVAATVASASAAGLVVDASTRPVGELTGHFDLVVANIGAAALRALAPAVAARVAPGGRLVLAGLLVEQVPEVAVAYEAEGLELIAVGERDGWASPSFLGKSTFSGA